MKWLISVLVGWTVLSAGYAHADEIFQIRIENTDGGRVQIRLTGDSIWTTVGRVMNPATVTVPTFPAAAYVPASSVAATAVHGIRIRVPSTGSNPRGISIQPRQFWSIPSGYGGHAPGRSGIETDIPAGRAIFRELAPLAGDSVSLEGQAGTGLTRDWQPSDTDVLIIHVTRPEEAPSTIEFENFAGGLVTARMPSGEVKNLARVIRPVTGVGRFDGTSYTGVGAVNTNHGGVITISTAPARNPPDEGKPPESRGGFSIQPSNHAKTQPVMTQAMVVGPLEGNGPLEGASPLFFRTIPLGNGSNTVDIRVGGGEWTRMPPVVGRIDNAFTSQGLRGLGIETGADSGGVTGIRINLSPATRDELWTTLQSAERREPDVITQTAVWTLSPPLPSRTAFVVFSSQGNTLAITNNAPYSVRLTNMQEGAVIRAEIIGRDGSVLETRQARLRQAGNNVVVEETGIR